MNIPLPSSKLFLLLLPLLVAGCWFSLRNSPDPLWLYSGDLLRENHVMIGEVPDSLQRLYCELHDLPYTPGDSTAFWLVSNPYLSNIEWTGFRDFCREAQKHNFLVVSGVTGVGSTKQTKHMARLLAANPENLMEIDCAPQFDLEYHKKYIGYEEEEQFIPGKLLEFWDHCFQHLDQNFVVVADNFDKINPETFFGPELWESLSSPRDTAVLGGKQVVVPPNFYFFSVTHLGPGSLIEMNEEHFKRLGTQYILDPNPRELLAWWHLQADKMARKPDQDDHAERLEALHDSTQLQRYLFYFLKANKFIRETYGDGFQLGQGSNVRYCYRDGDLSELKRVWLNHINALHPQRPLTEDDFSPLDFTLRSGGLERGSNFVARQIKFLEDTGYLVEITMVGTTALLTALAGWWVFRRREQLIRRYGDRAQQVYAGFEKQLISAEVAARRLEDIKKEVDDLVLRRKLGYTEGLYFLAFIEDRAKRIEFARNVSENFLELFNAFMEDNILTEGEYIKLKLFLQSIRHKIPSEIYEQFREKVEQAYASHHD
ncbi:MAG: hypothetical protein H6565_04635 [Lewinellaceae bacterium]|nr:hypothetical protein [Lewinellaceae bacterium]MCB9355763.1 hypothetical protein [Lewinellaceae bacterium]